MITPAKSLEICSAASYPRFGVSGNGKINVSGLKAANRYNDVQFWDFNWRKQGGSARMLEISKQEKFYKQEYCGCVYSLRDTNRWRKSQGREIIKRGINFYEIKA